MWRVVMPWMSEVLEVLPPELVEMIMKNVVIVKREVEELKRADIWDFDIKASYNSGSKVRANSRVYCGSCNKLDKANVMRRTSVVWRAVLSQIFAVSVVFYCKDCKS
nr:hypothetical protein K-LCC10_0013 [Kaumoebavirus]